MTHGTDGADTVSAPPPFAHNASRKGSAPRPRIVLLTPYTGGNLGDAAIQDAMIANIRLRLPEAQFSGISLNCDNFVAQHGMDAFPLCRTGRPGYGMCTGKVEDWRGVGESSTRRLIRKGVNAAMIKKALTRVPVLGRCVKALHVCWQELCHWVQGYRFLLRQDLLLVSGGGQLNEQCGGPWGQPFALFKWAVLARIARIPYVVASVGVGKASSTTSRLFLAVALRMAVYRSYRDKNSRAFAAGLLRLASNDPVVPDLAFSLPAPEIFRSAGIRVIAQGRPSIAISPIVYANPRFWPSTWYQNRALYERYVSQMARVATELLKRGYFLVIVYSSLGDDESVTYELLERLDDESKTRATWQMCTPVITTWKDLVAQLRDVDVLIASRLHSAILGFVTQTPTIAISYDRKVDWVMEDLGQTDLLLQISDFAAEDVIHAVDRIESRRKIVIEQIGSYRHRALCISERQYDDLAQFASASWRRSD